MVLSHFFEGEKQVYVYVSVKYCGSLPAENHNSGKVMHSIFIRLGSRKPEHHFPYSDFLKILKKEYFTYMSKVVFQELLMQSIASSEFT